MSKIRITFKELIQDSQDYGSDDEHMVSRAFFDVQYDENLFENCSVDIKQTVGSNFEQYPLEVSNPKGYEGPNDWEKFRYNVEVFYRSQVGSEGSGINIQGGSNVRMRNNRFITSRTFEYQVDGRSQEAGW